MANGLPNRIKGNLLSNSIFSQKLNNPLGYILLILLGVLLAFVSAKYGIIYGAIIIGVLVVIPLLIGIVADLNFGISLLILIGFLTGLIIKYIDAPMGLLNDGILFLLLFSLMLRLISDRDFSAFRHPITFFITIWLFYNFLALFNPGAETRIGWFYAVRPMAGLTLIYFISLYAIKDLASAKLLLKVILGITAIAGVYGLKQEFFGYSAGESAWLNADPLRYMLIVQWGRMRVFSFFSDPTTMGIIFVYISFLILGLITGPVKQWHKVVGILTIIILMMASAYGGSRTPVVLLPIGILYYLILRFNKKTIVSVLAILVLGAGFMMKSTSSGVIFRLQSAFNSKSYDTVNIRMENQRNIQPFLQDNPFGFGLASIGEWGKRFNENSWLSDFAHDSGFVRIAAELGYVGLLIYMTFLFVVMFYSVRYYFLVRDPMIKSIYFGINLVFFILIVSNYPQEAIIMLPTSLVFNVLLAMVVRLKDFDEHYVKTYKNK